MHYVYILQSQKDKKLYIGLTSNLKNRVKEHNSGECKSTKLRVPLELIFYEAYLNKQDAMRREKYFKTTKGKTTLKQMLKNYFFSLSKPWINIPYFLKVRNIANLF